MTSFCQEEKRKLRVWSSIGNYREKKTRKENRKNRFRFLQNIRKGRNRLFGFGIKLYPHTHKSLAKKLLPNQKNVTIRKGLMADLANSLFDLLCLAFIAAGITKCEERNWLRCQYELQDKELQETGRDRMD
jgi:hypothetical protein